MPGGLDGNVDIGLELNTSPAGRALDSFRSKMRSTFNSTDAKALDTQMRTTAKTIEGLEKRLDSTRSKLQDIISGRTTPKSVLDLQKELNKAYDDADRLGQQLDSLQIRRASLASKGNTGWTSAKPVEYDGKFYNEAQASQLESLDFKIQQVTKDFEIADDKSVILSEHLKELEANPALTIEAQQYNQELDTATNELKQQQAIYEELNEQQDTLNNNVGGTIPGLEGITKTLHRISGLIKRVFIFSLITKGLRALRTALGNVIAQDSQLSSSLNQIKGNLLTAFAPIWSIVLPALQALLNVLVQVTAYIAQFVALLTGKSIQASKASAKALYAQAAASKAAGGAAKQAAEDAEKSTLSFDELNTIETPKGDSGGGGGGGGGGAAAPAFETSDFTLTKELEEKLKAILVLVGLIGGALAIWKISEIIKDVGGLSKAFDILKGKVSPLIGIIMIIVGAFMLVKGYTDAWVNGIDWGNFALVLGGLALLIGGIALAISPMAAAAAAIGGGIALVVLGVKDFIDNGPSLQNILMIIIGLVVIFAAVWVLAASPIVAVVVVIALLIAIFVILWNKSDKFREFWITLWEKIKTAASTAWEGIKNAAVNAWTKIKETWSKVKEWFQERFDDIKEVFSTIKEVLGGFFSDAWESVKTAWNNVKQWFQDRYDDVTGVFDGIHEWFKTKFDEAWTAIKDVFTDFGTFFQGLWDEVKNKFTDFGSKLGTAIGDAVKAGINGAITLIEDTLNKGIGLINGAINLINKLPGVDVGKLPEITLPRLAQGAVIPPNKEFLAVLGDQKSGTNIEAPLSTIEQAVENVLSRKGYSETPQNININFTGNLAQLARILNPVIEREQRNKGTSLVKGSAY